MVTLWMLVLVLWAGPVWGQVTSVQSGAWSNAAIWSPHPPQAGDQVMIHHQVEVDEVTPRVTLRQLLGV